MWEKIGIDSAEAKAQKHIIDNSFYVDLNAKITSAKLPFIEDPVDSLSQTTRRQ